MNTLPELMLPVFRSPSVAKPTLPPPVTLPTSIDAADPMPTEKSPSVESVPDAVMLPSSTAPSASPLTRSDATMLPPVTLPSAEKSKRPAWALPKKDVPGSRQRYQAGGIEVAHADASAIEEDASSGERQASADELAVAVDQPGLDGAAVPVAKEGQGIQSVRVELAGDRDVAAGEAREEDIAPVQGELRSGDVSRAFKAG
jgi:hypothetical protein